MMHEGRPAEALRASCTNWLAEFNTALARRDAEAAAALFVHEGYWRDIVSFTWTLRTFHGRESIGGALAATFDTVQATGFRLEEEREPALKELNGVECIEAFFVFETGVARGQGVLRLATGSAATGASQALTLLTTAQELRGFEERVGRRRPRGNESTSAAKDWLDRGTAAATFEAADPEVLIVGAGQAGLALGARLRMLDVPTLLVDRNERVGDNWRNRYRSLKLHNQIHACHLPYVPFPPSWPAYVTKDQLGLFFEFYAAAMDLNVWMETSPVRGEFSEDDGRWTVELRLPDGGERIVRPRHFVLATGMSGLPKIPVVPGADEFAGTLVPASWYSVDETAAGKRAVVIGAGNSAHDIAQELHLHGADVTMVQRNSTCIVSLEPSAQAVFQAYREGGPPTEEVDLLSASIPYSIKVEINRSLTKQFEVWDAELLAALNGVGFQTDQGDDDSSFYIKYLRSGGGYYINVGCSDLIVEGKIKVKHGVGISRLTKEAVEFADGSSLPAEIVVFATGYDNMQEVVRNLLGDDVARRAGPAWGFDEHAELRNMWTRTGQEGFWYMGGSLAECRNYSRYVAVQIKAAIEGLVPWRTAPIRSSTNAMGASNG